MKLEYDGKVLSDGRLYIRQAEQMKKDLKRCRDRKEGEINITVTIQVRNNKVTNKQRGYWYKVVIPHFKDGWNKMGWNYTLKQTEELAQTFLNWEVPTEEGILVNKVGLSAEIPKEVISDAIEKIKIFSAEHLDTYIPDSNEKVNK